MGLWIVLEQFVMQRVIIDHHPNKLLILMSCCSSIYYGTLQTQSFASRYKGEF